MTFDHAQEMLWGTTDPLLSRLVTLQSVWKATKRTRNHNVETFIGTQDSTVIECDHLFYCLPGLGLTQNIYVYFCHGWIQNRSWV